MSKAPKTDRQREHQANERTFLAWVRTAIALIGFGLAIARFGLFLQQFELSTTQKQPLYQPPFYAFINSDTLGIVLVIAGVLMTLLAAWNYNRIFCQIERSDYRPSRLMVGLTAGTVLILGLLSLLFVVLRSPPARNPASSHHQQGKVSSLPNFRPL